MPERVETIIVGGGQAGIALSACLKDRDRDHLVLEAADGLANVWRNQRWDSFTLVTPNWTVQLPGGTALAADPDGFLDRDAVVALLEHYGEKRGVPIQFGRRVDSVAKDDVGYRIDLDGTSFRASNVVIATGLYQQPKTPAWVATIPDDLPQLTASTYRNSEQIPAGRVLVVGSGQSGCQIVEDLRRAGRSVNFAIGSAGRVPRKRRGRDMFRWLADTGFLDRTVAQLPSPAARFAGNPHVSGRDGGQSLNLHLFARAGIQITGRPIGVEGGQIRFAPDRDESLAKSDTFAANLAKLVDDYVARTGLAAELTDDDTMPEAHDAYDQPNWESLPLSEFGAIIWAIGYRFDFSLVRLPVFDSFGFPLSENPAPGLFFHGLPWCPKQKTGLFLGIAEASEALATTIVAGGIR